MLPVSLSEFDYNSKMLNKSQGPRYVAMQIKLKIWAKVAKHYLSLFASNYEILFVTIVVSIFPKKIMFQL